MDGGISFFFSSRQHIHRQYSGFFEFNEQDENVDDGGVEETPEIPTKEVVARFYFTLIYRLANKDITKFNEVENMNLYLCLSVASLMKDEAEKEREELKKMEKKYQMK